MALIKCLECGNEVSDQAEFCPHCGIKIKLHSQPPDKSVTVKPDSEDKKHMPAKVAIPIILIAAVVIVTIVTVSNISQRSGNHKAEPTRSSYNSQNQGSESYSIEYKMASINKGQHVSRNDPTIESFKTILDRLDRECPESKSLIADMIVKTWDMYKEETGRNVSLLWIAQQLNESVVSGMNKSLKFAEIAAAWLTLVKS